MNKRINLLHTASLLLLLAGGMTILASCEKSENGGNEATGKGGTCRVLPPLVTIEPFGAEPATRAGEAAEPEEIAFNVGEELGNVLTMESVPEADAPATRALAAGTYYRIVVYKKADWDSGGAMTILEQRLCKTGSTDYYDTSGNVETNPILLKEGDYVVFCYSLNSTTVPVPSLSNASINVRVSDGEDFLSETADLKITSAQLATDVPLPAIQLKHRCCKITGSVSAEYFTNSIILTTPDPPTLSVGILKNSYGEWNIKQGTMTVTYPSGYGNIEFKPITLTLESPTKHSGSIIVLPPKNQILQADYKFWPGSAAAAISAKGVALSSSATTFTGGSNHTFSVKAIAAYVLTSTNPVEINGIKWARSNLDGLTSNFETEPWISGPMDGINTPSKKGSPSSTQNDWWTWNYLDASGDINEYKTSTTGWESIYDPCLQKIGTNWRIPKHAELQNLATAVLPSKKVLINNLLLTTTATGWVTHNLISGNVFYDSDRNVLFLPAAGYCLSYQFSNAVNYGYYWSSYYYRQSLTDCSYSLEISATGVNSSKSLGIGAKSTVRCVQD